MRQFAHPASETRTFRHGDVTLHLHRSGVRISDRYFDDGSGHFMATLYDFDGECEREMCEAVGCEIDLSTLSPRLGGSAYVTSCSYPQPRNLAEEHGVVPILPVTEFRAVGPITIDGEPAEKLFDEVTA